MSDQHKNRPRLPPRWFVRLFWHAHRGVYRVTGGRVGLWRPRRYAVGQLATHRQRGVARGRSEA